MVYDPTNIYADRLIVLSNILSMMFISESSVFYRGTKYLQILSVPYLQLAKITYRFSEINSDYNTPKVNKHSYPASLYSKKLLSEYYAPLPHYEPNHYWVKSYGIRRIVPYPIQKTTLTQRYKVQFSMSDILNYDPGDMSSWQYEKYEMY